MAMKSQGYCPVNGQYQGLCGCAPGQCFERDEYPHTFNGQVEHFNLQVQTLTQAIKAALTDVLSWARININKDNRK